MVAWHWASDPSKYRHDIVTPSLDVPEPVEGHSMFSAGGVHAVLSIGPGGGSRDTNCRGV
jgi:hypothetical protein